MSATIFLARIIGPYCVIVGLSLLLNRKMYQQMLQEFENCSPWVCFGGGIIALIIGLLIISTHNVWICGWPLVITLLGWIAFIKGTSLMLFPRVTMSMTKILRNDLSGSIIYASIVIVLGIGLTFIAYF